MTSFENTWWAVEALELEDPLKELGSFLRSQPGTGIDKSVFADNPSAMQKARLFNALKDANPDLSGATTGMEYKRKNFEFWRDNQDMLDKCAAALKQAT